MLAARQHGIPVQDPWQEASEWEFTLFAWGPAWTTSANCQDTHAVEPAGILLDAQLHVL